MIPRNHNAYPSSGWKGAAIVESLKKSFPIPLGKRRRGLFSSHFSPGGGSRAHINRSALSSRGPSDEKVRPAKASQSAKSCKSGDDATDRPARSL